MITNLENLIGHFSENDRTNNKIKIVSFDIFDTLLIRKIDPPDEVKKIVSDNVERAGLIDISANELLTLRNTCEQRLRRQAQDNDFDPECSIREIMDLVCAELQAQSGVTEELVDVETKVEDALTAPMPGIDILLSKLENDYRLIAVSDTYLPLDIIESLLKSAGLRDYFERIYCSCEYRLNKGSGRLFSKILEIEEISPDQILHIGDNAISDYTIPKGLGISSIHLYDEWNMKRRKFLQNLQDREHKSDFWKGFSFTHKILSHQRQLSSPSFPEDEFYSWGKNTVGPLLTLYIHLVITELRNEGIERFYFVARDGFILQQIFNILSDKLYGNAIGSPQYLYLSRYTSFISSIKNFSKRELDMTLFGDNTSVGNVMDRLGLGESDEINAILKKKKINISKKLSYPKLKKTIKTLIKDPEFSTIVFRHAEKTRKLIEKHLRQHGVFSSKDDRIAIVDIGWLGTIQGCIEHSFAEHEDFPHILGFYLALNPPLFDLAVNKKGLICDYRSSTPDERAMIFFREALEFPCRPDHGATIGYEEKEDGTVSPLFADNPDEKKIMPHIENIQKGILDFAQEYAGLINIFDISPDELKPYVVKHYNTQLGYPAKATVKAFERLSNADDFGSGANRGIVRDYSIRDFFNYREFRRTLAEIPWKEGSLSKARVPFMITCYNLAKRLICWNLTKFYIHEQDPD